MPYQGWIVALAALLAGAGGLDRELPARPGMCVWTKIKRVEHRLQEGEHGPFIKDSGSAVEFENGGYQVDYAEWDEVNHSRAGDPVMMCLVSIPQHCPKGDNRGRVYTTTNLRTLGSWTMRDSEHSCGGA